LFLAPALLVCALVLAIAVHLFVIGYEEPALRDQFGPTYDEYRRSVSRWIPRRPWGSVARRKGRHTFGRGALRWMGGGRMVDRVTLRCGGTPTRLRDSGLRKGDQSHAVAHVPANRGMVNGRVPANRPDQPGTRTGLQQRRTAIGAAVGSLALVALVNPWLLIAAAVDAGVIVSLVRIGWPGKGPAGRTSIGQRGENPCESIGGPSHRRNGVAPRLDGTAIQCARS